MLDSATLLLTLQRLLSDLSERAIHLDPVVAKSFASLAGQVIEIHCLEPALTWHLTLQEAASKSMRVRATSKRRRDRQANGTTANTYDRRHIGNRRHRRRRRRVDGAADSRKDYSPDLAKPLDAWLGRETGQRTAALVELGMATLASC